MPETEGGDRVRMYEAYINLCNKAEEGLADYAAKSIDAVRWDGRQHMDFVKSILEQPKPEQSRINRYRFRTPYQLDRDRILYSGFFPPLAHKTQMFSGLPSPIVRNRLTHTLIVNQIARSIARGLHLNEDLVEAIALGHDVGHAPFAHTGEEALNEWIREVLRAPLEQKMKSPRQTKLGEEEKQEIDQEILFIRREFLVEKGVEPSKLLFGNGQGDTQPMLFMNGKQSFKKLTFITTENLTKQTLFGIWRHSRKLAESDRDFLYEDREGGSLSSEFLTFETEVVRLADDMAWITHDVEDARRVGLVSDEALSKRGIPILPLTGEREPIGLSLGSGISNWLTAFVSDAIETNEAKGLNVGRLRRGEQHITPSEQYEEILRMLKNEISKSVHEHPEVRRAHENAKAMVKRLCDHYYSRDESSRSPSQLLSDLSRITEERGGDNRTDFPFYPDNKETQVQRITRMWNHPFRVSARVSLICDFVSSLTDGEVEALYVRHFGPRVDKEKLA